MPDILLRDKLWGLLSWGKLSSFFSGRFCPNVFRPLGVGVTLLNPTQVHGSYFPYPTLLDNTYPLLPYSCLSPYSILMTFFPALGYLIIPTHLYCTGLTQGSPGVGRNTFLSSPHLCFIIVFICDLFVSRDDPLMS